MSLGPRWVILGLSCTACVTSMPAFMAPIASLDTRAPGDAAQVVFVSESSACDGGEPFRLVDERLNYLGDSPPASKFSVHIAAGHHTFFAWQPEGDIPPEEYPQANQVGVVEGDFAAGQTYYVAVGIRNGHFALRKSCDNYHGWLSACWTPLTQGWRASSPACMPGGRTLPRGSARSTPIGRRWRGMSHWGWRRSARRRTQARRRSRPPGPRGGRERPRTRGGRRWHACCSSTP
jgi:hypothetical protein